MIKNIGKVIIHSLLYNYLIFLQIVLKSKIKF